MINAAQVLLKRKFPAVESLQSCTLAEKLAFDPQGEAEFVQTLNVGGNYRITTSTIGCEAGSIMIYDSLRLKLYSVPGHVRVGERRYFRIDFLGNLVASLK